MTDDEVQRSTTDEAVIWRLLFMAMIRVLNTVEGDVKALHDLTMLDLGILFATAHRDDAVPMGAIATLFGVDPSVITYRVKRLERRGLIERGGDALDRRIILVRSTAAGRQILPRARRAMLDSAHTHFFAHIDSADLPVLAAVFGRLRPRGA